MRWLHTWTGVTAGWIIFLIFFNGSAAYFRKEITVWMQPEVAAKIDLAASVAGAVTYLKTRAPDAANWTITVPDTRTPAAEATWTPRRKSGDQMQDDDDDRRVPASRRMMIDAAGQPIASRGTEGGEYFLQFHYAFHYLPLFLGFCFVTLASIGLMVALTTGVIIHRRIFAQFFTFRPGNGAGSWLDAHTVFAVLPLPFHIMITYTGGAIAVFFLMPWSIVANYSHPQSWVAEMRGTSPPQPSGRTATLVSVDTIIKKAESTWGCHCAETIRVNNPGDMTATIEVKRHPRDPVAGDRGESLVFNGVTGALIHASLPRRGLASASAMIFGLHEAHFAPPVLRVFMFLCGAMGTAMAGSGLLLWTARRRRQLPAPDSVRRGFHLMDKFNVAIIAGYPAATAAYFWANRLLPTSFASRADVEVACAFGCWGVLLLWAIFRPQNRAWMEICGVAAVLFLALPIMNAATAPRGTVHNLLAGDALYFWFDVISLVIGLFFAAASVRCLQQLKWAKMFKDKTGANGQTIMEGQP